MDVVDGLAYKNFLQHNFPSPFLGGTPAGG